MRRRHIPGEPEPPTKGELKRQAHSVQELGEQLIDAPDAVLEALELPETLLDAIHLARRITSHGALLRQKMYIGKLMRKIDVEPIRERLESQQAARRNEARRFHRVEHWRDRIVDEGETAIGELVADYPTLDSPQFRALAAEARRERGQEGSRRSSRELFRALNEAMAQD
jgi:ribosome-associated protein